MYVVISYNETLGIGPLCLKQEITSPDAGLDKKTM